MPEEAAIVKNIAARKDRDLANILERAAKTDKTGKVNKANKANKANRRSKMAVNARPEPD